MPEISQRAELMPASPIRKLVPLAEAARSRGIRIYHLNIGQPDLPSPQTGLAALKKIDRNVLEYSPSDGYRSLREKLAGYYQQYQIKLSPEEIIVTTGGSEAVLFAFMSCLNPGDEIIVPEPAYANYMAFAVSAGAVIRPITASIEDGFALPSVEKFEELINDRTRGILICNPNNPTATLIDSDELHAFQKKLPEHVLLVVDEAYIDFVEDPNYRTMVDAIADDENLIVVRTFSKLYGMAGARMGYLMANREIIEYLQRDSTGFCCSRMGLHAAEAALDDVEFQEMTKKGNQEGREILVSCMKELGFRVWPSHTNFIYFDPGVDVKWFADRLLDYGIIIRGNFKANRISIGTPEEDRFVCKAMREIMANR